MEWAHKCSLDWLLERQDHITASDIRSLVPFTKTGRPRTITDEDYLRVWAKKVEYVTVEDCWSYGAAARGHLLEPYAIDAANEMLDMYGLSTKLYHWDDRLVTLPGRSLAFSPDALDIPMDGDITKATVLGEVKSYSVDRHITTAYEDKSRIDERWQIAASMALLDSLDHAWLILFNPKILRSTFIIRFDRSELEKEIKAVLEVERKWDDFVDDGIIRHAIVVNNGLWSPCGMSEQEIHDDIEYKRDPLNPVV